MDLVSLVSNIDQRLDQNVLRNLLSRSEMIDYGIPKCTHTRSKKSLAVASAVIFDAGASAPRRASLHGKMEKTSKGDVRVTVVTILRSIAD